MSNRWTRACHKRIAQTGESVVMSNTTTSGCRARSRSPAAGGGTSKNTTRASPHRSRLALIPESSSDFPYNRSHIEIAIYQERSQRMDSLQPAAGDYLPPWPPRTILMV